MPLSRVSPYAAIALIVDLMCGRSKYITDVDKCNAQAFFMRLMDDTCSTDIAVRVNLDRNAKLVGRYTIGANPVLCVYCCVSVDDV